MGLVNLNSPTSFYSFSDNPFAPSSVALPAIEISGSKGGWQGFYFKDFTRSLLVNPQFQGFYDNGGANWILRINNGILDIGKINWNCLASVPDTRSVDGLVDSYSRTLIPEFKTGSVIGVTTASPGFVGLITFAPWSDDSGGPNYQLAFRPEGLLWRSGDRANGWDSWQSFMTPASDTPGSISNESSGTWTPVIKGSTGAGTAVYTTRVGTWRRVGSIFQAHFDLAFTLSGATGSLVLEGLPFNLAKGAITFSKFGGITFPSGCTQVNGRIGNNSTSAVFYCSGASSVGTTILANTTYTSPNMEGIIHGYV